MAANNIPTALVVFGATGDLMTKKITPALYNLFTKNKLPKLFRVIGYARRPLTDEQFREHVSQILRTNKHIKKNQKELDSFLKRFVYKQGQFEVLKDYESLAEDLGRVDQEWKVCSNKLFYTAVPPEDYQGIFQSIYSYDSTSIFVQAIGDINGDGIKEVHLRTTDTLNGKFYKADSIGALPTSFDFVFYFQPIGQINDLTFGDFDKNGKTDCIFIDWPTVYIGEYDSSLNNFVQCFDFQIQANDAQSGFAVGDFDQDGKMEIVFGTALKKVYVIEAKGENEYQVVWLGDAPTYNAYMITSTDDIDGNGKPEFWVGGQDHLTGISTFWAYESNGQNNYIPVASIELRYLVSLYTNYLQTSDIDNDGKNELIINIGNYLLVIKFTGQPDQHNYEICYAKIGELTEPTTNFQPSTVYDLNNDGRKDILIPMDKYVNPNTIVFSYLLVQDSITSVDEKILANDNNFFLRPNYPNPFNPVTRIEFVLGKSENTTIKVYNSLGKEIATLVNEYLPSGKQAITWDGKDDKGNTVSSGVYFIQITAGSYRQTIKAVLLK